MLVLPNKVSYVYVFTVPMMTNQEFGEMLRKWRGRRYQKEVADLIGVSIITYQSWEQGQHQPEKICQNCVLEKMKSNP